MSIVEFYFTFLFYFVSSYEVCSYMPHVYVPDCQSNKIAIYSTITRKFYNSLSCFALVFFPYFFFPFFYPTFLFVCFRYYSRR